GYPSPRKGFLMRRTGAWWFVLAFLSFPAATFPVLNAQNTGKPLKKSEGEPAKGVRSVVKNWKVEDFEPLLEDGLTGRSFDRGKRVFKEARCALCHTFADE